MLPPRLIDGYLHFLESRFSDESLRYKHLAQKGQKPDILVISCCDSRVAPEVIFDAGPGELFVVRNVANLVPPCETDTTMFHGTSAAIEYAVKVLEVEHVVILGHAFCGGINACTHPHLTQQAAEGSFLGKWVSQITPVAKDLAQTYITDNTEDFFRALELAVIRHSMKNLETYPFIRQKMHEGRLSLHGAYFGVASGRLLVLDADTGEFVAPHPKHDAPQWAKLFN